MDESLIADYQFVFNGRQGQNVLDDLRNICGYDEPLTSEPLPDDRELIKRAVWHDVYKYIEAMANARED
jgi:hypothetical protein